MKRLLADLTKFWNEETSPDERAIRELLSKEYDAVKTYEDLIVSAENPLTKKVAESIRDEELVHIGELEELLFQLGMSTKDSYNTGAKEVKDLLGGGAHEEVSGKMHADRKEDLRPLKEGEFIGYGGAAFHIYKKEETNDRKDSSEELSEGYFTVSYLEKVTERLMKKKKEELDELEEYIIHRHNNGIRVKNKQLLELHELVFRLVHEKNLAYRERGMTVAGLSHVFPSYLSKQDENSTKDLNNIVYIDIPNQGQVSWHIKDELLPLFSHLKFKPNVWDGHDTFEKYKRLLSYRCGINRYLDEELLSDTEQYVSKEGIDRNFKGCSLAKDKDGYFVYTHRARSKSYEAPEKISLKDIDFIDSTG